MAERRRKPTGQALVEFALTLPVLIVLVAIIKAVCVASVFMHLKFDWGRLYCIVIPVSILAVMMVIVLLPDIVIGWHHGFSARTDDTAVVAPKQ